MFCVIGVVNKPRVIPKEPALPYRLLILLMLLIPSSGMLAHSAPVLSGQIAPNVASYRMDVRLDPISKTIIGTERITYINPSPDTLSEIWLRLYLRAFRDANSTW